jgi:hypothetical protein
MICITFQRIFLPNGLELERSKSSKYRVYVPPCGRRKVQMGVSSVTPQYQLKRHGAAGPPKASPPSGALQ